MFNFILFPILKFSWLNNFSWINKRAREENNPKYIHRIDSDIRKMNIIQRFLLNYQTENALDLDYFKKIKLVKIYLHELKDLINKEIIIIPGIVKKDNLLSLVGVSCFNQIPILIKNRKKLLDFLISGGFDIAAQHIRSLSQTYPYNEYSFLSNNETNDVVNKIILLPCYASYKESDVLDLCRKIINFYRFYNN